MDGIKQTVLSICLVAVATGILKMLIPSGTFNKQINMLISCFFLISILVPITNGKIDIDFEIPEIEATGYEDLKNRVSTEISKETAKNLSDRLYDVLKKNNIFPEEIYITVNNADIYGISISDIRLVLKQEDKDKIKQAIMFVTKEVGDDIEVYAVLSDKNDNKREDDLNGG